jgi:hypothetical protein
MRWFKSNLGEAPKDFDSINSELVKENELLNSRLKINTEYLDRANKLIEIIEKLNQTDQKVFELLSNSTKKFFEKDLKNCYFDILEFSDSKESNNMPEDESEYKKKIQINENDRKFLQKNNKIKNLSNTRAQVIQIVTDFIIKKNNSLSNPDLEQIRDTLKRTSVEPSEILSVLEKKDKNDKINNLIYAIKAEEISLEIFNFFRRRIQIVIDSSKNLSFLISKIIMKKDFEKLSESEKEQIFDQINKELEKYLEIHKQICEIDSDCVIEFYGEDPDNFIHYDENNFDAEKYKKELENKKEQKCKIYKFEDLELPAPNLNIKLEKTEFEKIESFLGN